MNKAQTLRRYVTKITASKLNIQENVNKFFLNLCCNTSKLWVNNAFSYYNYFHSALLITLNSFSFNQVNHLFTHEFWPAKV